MRLLLILVLWYLSFSSYAGQYTGVVNPERATAAEMLGLPEFCQLRFKWGPESTEFSKWKNILGPEYLHAHHYCEGLIDLMRVATVAKHKQGMLDSARANFYYVLQRVQNPKFVLLPDLYYRLAIVSKEEGKISEAIDFANKSIQAKKNFLNPYLLLADLYIKASNKTEARKVLLEAKEYHPNSKRLKRRFKETE